MNQDVLTGWLTDVIYASNLELTVMLVRKENCIVYSISIRIEILHSEFVPI